jgi:hypothetical protein
MLSSDRRGWPGHVRHLRLINSFISDGEMEESPSLPASSSPHPSRDVELQHLPRNGRSLQGPVGT